MLLIYIILLLLPAAIVGSLVALLISSLYMSLSSQSGPVRIDLRFAKSKYYRASNDKVFSVFNITKITPNLDEIISYEEVHHQPPSGVTRVDPVELKWLMPVAIGLVWLILIIWNLIYLPF